MKSKVSQDEYCNLISQYINGNIKESMNTFAKMCSNDKSGFLEKFSDMCGAECALQFVHKYLLSREQ